MEFNYKGIRVIYNEDFDSEETISDFLDELFEFYYEDLKNVKVIDFSNGNSDYFLIDGNPYQYSGGRLYLFDAENDEIEESFKGQEYFEYRNLCKELGLETYDQILAFVKEHNCKNDQELLNTLRDVVKSKNECVDDVRFMSEDLFNPEEAEEDKPVDNENTTEEKVEDEPKTFEEKMDFLAADEQEAIEGYQKIIATIDDEHVKEQLNKIMIEEKAHKEYLEKVKEDQSIDYTEPLEDEEESDEEKEEIDEDLKLREGKEVNDLSWTEICGKMQDEPLIALNGGNKYQYVDKVKDLNGNEKPAVIGYFTSLKDLYNDYPKAKKLKVYIPVKA